MPLREQLITLILLLGLSAFFSGAETALVSLSRIRIKHLVEKKPTRTNIILRKLKEDPHRMLNTILIGNNLVNIGAASMATSLAMDFFASYAIGIATGASYAGKKVLTATSGPGVSLMTETIGLASIAEIHLVIVNVMRGGPSTGIPTKLEQSDLAQAVFGTHGDANKVILAPVDVRDCFYVVNKAYYISEKFQIPVIVLSDQFIGGRLDGTFTTTSNGIENIL